MVGVQRAMRRPYNRGYAPAVDEPLVDKPGEFTLRHDGVLQVEPTVLPDVHLTQV